MKIVNDCRITKYGMERLNTLLNSPKVNDYHKTLLKGIKNDLPKNVHKAQADILDEISKQYGDI